LRKKCVEQGIISKSLLLQIARQPTEKKMVEMLRRILQGGLTRDERGGSGGKSNPVRSGHSHLFFSSSRRLRRSSFAFSSKRAMFRAMS